jgi:hypothetical protein
MPDIVDPANTLTVWVQNTAYWGKPMITVDTNGTWYVATCYECNFTKYGMGSSSIQHGLHRIISQKIIYSLLYIMDTSYTPLENPDLSVLDPSTVGVDSTITTQNNKFTDYRHFRWIPTIP